MCLLKEELLSKAAMVVLIFASMSSQKVAIGVVIFA
jgi:hypothetical protein